MTSNKGNAVKSSPLPSVGDFLFLWIMQITLFLLPDFLFAEGSSGWHLVAGDFIHETATIPRVDLVSCTFADKAWVAYEWLFDVLMAMTVDFGGLKLLAVVLSAVIGFLFLFIYDRTRREGAGIGFSFFLLVIAILTALTHWHARPHLVTFWGVWIFLTTLEDFYRDAISWRRLFFVLCAMMLFWVNCHPAFMLGFVVLSMYVISAVVQALRMKALEERAAFKKKALLLFALSAALFGITFINPYGVGLHKYIFSYLEGKEILVNTQEFLSPVFKGGLHPTCLEILFFLFAGGLYVSKQKISMPGLMTCLAFGHGALSAVRNMPLYAIVVTSFIGRLWGKPPGDSAAAVSKEGDASTEAQGAGSFFGRIKKSLSDFQEQEAKCTMHILPLCYTAFLIIVALSGGSFMGNEMLKSTWDPKFLPSETLTYIKKNKVEMKQTFNFDNWGGYLRYVLGQRVFIDDRADFYGLHFYAKYSTVMAVGDGWQKVLDENKMNWVLFPKGSALAATLRSNPDWKSVASDEASELFERRVRL